MRMAVAPVEAAQARPGLARQIAQLPFNFWVCNLMEMLERLAFFSVLAIRPLFAVKPASENGLGLDFAQRGLVFGIWAWLQCILPMISGGYTDRYGYRRSLLVAFTLNAAGYLLLARSAGLALWLGQAGLPNPGFWVLLAAAGLVASGTAVFKPAVQGTLARAARDETSSMVWGIFYWVVNIGGFLAPMAAAWLRGEQGLAWHNVFYGAALVTALNFLPALLLYREPEKPAGAAEQQHGPLQVFASSLGTLLRDAKFVLFLLIVSCFWLMFMQLWDLLPNFIDEWVDTRDVAPVFGWLSPKWILPSGQVKPEMIINIDSASIILLVILISWMIGRLNKIAAMLLGMVIALVGFVGAGATGLGWLCCLMIFIFAIGEMICSPTFSAYVGLIAPPHRKALYMGYSNIPFAIGWGIGNLLAGQLYEHVGSRQMLARTHLVREYHLPAELAKDKQAIPAEQALPALAFVLQTGDVATLQRAAGELRAVGKATPEQVDRAYAPIRDRATPEGLHRATELLWRTYRPQQVWYYLGAVGLAGILGMSLFYAATRHRAAAPPAEEPPGRQCPAEGCRQPNPPGARYCGHCGRELPA
jgi:MFS family permease